MSTKRALVINPIALAAVGATGNHDLSEFAAQFDEVVGFLRCSAVSGTSPTLDLVYQVSPDGTTWYTHTSFTQVTGVTTERKVFTVPGVKSRLLYTIGGTDTPTVTFSVHIEGKRNGKD